MSVIHGSGKPRIEIPTATILSNSVSSATSTTVTLGSAAGLDALDLTYILKNRLVSTYNSTGGVTEGRIVSWDDATDVITVDGWTDGDPAVDSLKINGFRIDLPYCQQLLEGWRPDFITWKLANGNIDIVKRGFYYTAILDYSQFADGDLVEDFAALFKTLYKNFIFYPRRDNTDVSYTVDLSPDTVMQLAQARGHRFHKFFRIELIGTRRISDINLRPLGESAYGRDYGSDYGYGL